MTSMRRLSCGRPLCGELNAVIDDAVKGMRIDTYGGGLYGRYKCGAHAYGEKHTVDEYLRWLSAYGELYGSYTGAVPPSTGIRRHFAA